MTGRFWAVSAAVCFCAAAAQAQPSFLLAAQPSSVYVNEDAAAGAEIQVSPVNGFTGSVALSISNLPKGVIAVLNPPSTTTSSTLVFEAEKTAATGVSTVTVTGTSAGITQSVSINLAVSAATGMGGSGTLVDLSPAYNVYGIYTDGTPFSTGGLDGVGFAFSTNLLTPWRNYDGNQFDFGPADQPDAVSGTAEPIMLPAGQFGKMLILGNGVEGNQMHQLITVTYTDGTSSRFERNFSDWFTPQDYPGEHKAVTMSYRDEASGGLDNRGNFYLYCYPFLLDSTKTVESLTLPNNRDLVMLAVTLTLN